MKLKCDFVVFSGGGRGGRERKKNLLAEAGWQAEAVGEATLKRQK